MGEMSSKWTLTPPAERQSKWHVTALGEAQMDGGVGGQLNDTAFDDRIQTANPNGADFADNAGNSYEQEVALKTWVDMAVDMLNRGSNNDDVLAKLAHDGCPDPQTVMEMAMQQPEQEMVDDQAGEDAFPSMPPAAQQPQPGMGDSTSTPPSGVQAKVYETMWGEKIAMPERTVTPAPDPVLAVQEFLDALEPVEASHPETMLARIENLKTARRAIRGIGQRAKLSWVQAQQLVALDDDTQAELLHLSCAAGDLAFQTADEYLASQRESSYHVNAFHFEGSPDCIEPELQAGIMSHEGAEKLAKMNEHAEVLAYENAHLDKQALWAAAHRYISPVAADFKDGIQLSEKFARLVLAHAEKYTPVPEAVEKTASTDDFAAEGPAEALFL